MLISWDRTNWDKNRLIYCVQKSDVVTNKIENGPRCLFYKLWLNKYNIQPMLSKKVITCINNNNTCPLNEMFMYPNYDYLQHNYIHSI